MSDTPSNPAEGFALADLTLPREDSRTLREVTNRHSRLLLETLFALPLGALPSPLQAALREGQRHLRELLRRDPRPLARTLRHPTCSALLVTVARQLGTGADSASDPAAATHVVGELYANVFLDLATRGLLPEEGYWLRREALSGGAWPPMRSPALGSVLQPAAEVVELGFLPRRLVVRTSGGEEHVALDSPDPAGVPSCSVTRAYHRVADGLDLALTDNNPLHMFEAHPEKAGNALDLGGRPAEEWVESLRASLALIDRFLPRLGQEIRLLLRLVVPVGYHAQRHLSASYQEAVGTVYLTLHPSLMTMTEALVHEFQHNKLNAAFALDPLLENAFSPLFASPVRPDPRPLHGVLLAVHAFQPVAALYEGMAAAGHPFSRSSGWDQRFRGIIAMIRSGAATVLANARPTPMGRALFEEMAALDAHFARYAEERWPGAPAASALDL